jgi:hypothetical protein
LSETAKDLQTKAMAASVTAQALDWPHRQIQSTIMVIAGVVLLAGSEHISWPIGEMEKERAARQAEAERQAEAARLWLALAAAFLGVGAIAWLIKKMKRKCRRQHDRQGST